MSDDEGLPPELAALANDNQDEAALRSLHRLASAGLPVRGSGISRKGMEPLRRPAPNPCEACPYRADVPSGVWADSEYVKLVDYDKPTGEQPTGLFQCHQTSADDPKARVCGGWAAVHRQNPRGHELLALRLAEAFNSMRPDDLYATAMFRTRVPLFASATAAAAHGMRELDHPSLEARVVMDKIIGRRPDVTARGRPIAELFDPSDEDEDDNLIWPDHDGGSPVVRRHKRTFANELARLESVELPRDVAAVRKILSQQLKRLHTDGRRLAEARELAVRATAEALACDERAVRKVLLTDLVDRQGRRGAA